MADLAELLERVKAATGPDRETDARLYVELIARLHRPDIEQMIAQRAASHPDTNVWLDGARDWQVPKYTASLDAALALVERVKPGQPIIMGDRQGPATKPWSRIGPAWRDADATGATLALAVLTALLSVLIDQAAQDSVGESKLTRG